jgi:hypothetical protein
MNNVLFKKSWNFSNWQCVYFVWPLDYLIKKPPVPMKQATIRLIKVKSCSAVLRKLMVCIDIYPKISSEIQILNFGCLSSRHSILTRAGMWGSMVIFCSQKGFMSKKFGEHCTRAYTSLVMWFSNNKMTGLVKFIQNPEWQHIIKLL